MAPFQELKQLADDHNIKAMVIPAQTAGPKPHYFRVACLISLSVAGME